MVLWMKKQLYTCTCPAEKEFRLFLDLGQCLDYAIAHGPESHTPILMSDPIGMLWVAECVLHGDDAGYLVILGPCLMPQLLGRRFKIACAV